jgi:outer membrane protein assembly factor BamB
MRSSSVLVLLAFAVLGRAEDWPQWRGPNRDGVAVKPRLPANWPDKPPRPLWKQTVGEGQSSPVVVGDRLFILGRTRDEEGCFCMSVKSGKMLWQTTYPCTYKPTDVTSGFGPKSTPTVDGDRVYMLGIAGMFHCFDVKTGKVLWKHDLRSEFWGAAKDEWGDDAWATCCGAAASPLVFRRRDGKDKKDPPCVLLPVGGKKAGAMTAFDRRDGKVVWKSPLADRSSYSSPLVVTLGGVRQLVGFTGLRMVGLTTDGGELLWEYPFPAAFEQTVITPVIWKDLVIVAGERKATVALKISKAEGKWTAKPAWSNPQLRGYLSSPVVVKDHLIGLNHRNQLVSIDLATGKTAWAGGNFSTYCTLTIAGDSLLVLTYKGELHVLEADPKKLTRKVTWQLPVADPVWAHLAVAGSRLYVKDHTDVYCFDLAR